VMGQKFCEEVRLIVFFSSAAICNRLDPSFCHGDVRLVPQSW
jgi:hypothetical protein